MTQSQSTSNIEIVFCSSFGRSRRASSAAGPLKIHKNLTPAKRFLNLNSLFSMPSAHLPEGFIAVENGSETERKDGAVPETDTNYPRVFQNGLVF